MGRVPTQKTIMALVSNLSNPQILYAGSGDGVFKSEDAGGTWQAMNTGLSETRVVSVALYPTEPSQVYALTASGVVFRSTDGAATWQRQGQLPQE